VDKQRVVLHLLEDAEWGQWSDREIARHCGVGHALVSRLRRSLSPGDSDTAPRTYRIKQGTVATMETRAIGKRTASPPETPAADAEAPVQPSAPQDGAGCVPTPETMVDSAKTVASPGPATPHPSPSDPAPGPGFDPSAFVTLLRTLKTFPDPATLVTGIPQMFDAQIDLHLLGALAWLRKFNEEWKSHTLTPALPDEEPDEERWA
jgi:hypothetical protein